MTQEKLDELLKSSRYHIAEIEEDLLFQEGAEASDEDQVLLAGWYVIGKGATMRVLDEEDGRKLIRQMEEGIGSRS